MNSIFVTFYKTIDICVQKLSYAIAEEKMRLVTLPRSLIVQLILKEALLLVPQCIHCNHQLWPHSL